MGEGPRREEAQALIICPSNVLALWSLVVTVTP